VDPGLVALGNTPDRVAMLARGDRRGIAAKLGAARRVLKGATMNYLASRTALALFAVFSATGCALAGDRVGGVCPIGETCSNQAPEGLFFLGASTADSFGGGVAITAAGGSQTIKVLLGSNTDSPAFKDTFDASTSDVTVAAIGSIAPPNVVVSGKSDGTTSLRLLESGTTKLLDRVDIQVATIAKVTLFPRELFLVAPDDGTPWALLSGAKIPMIVQLSAESKERLIDEKLTLTPATGEATQQAWDVFEITAGDAGEASFTVKAGQASFTPKATIVATIDGIDRSQFLNQLGADGSLEASQDQILCFEGKSKGVLTIGAKWKFTGSETIAITSQSPDATGMSSCVQLKGTAVGPAKLTVEASGFTKVVDINFTKKTSRSARGASSLAATRYLAPAAAGERAGGN
jgi:hypothetical protein